MTPPMTPGTGWMTGMHGVDDTGSDVAAKPSPAVRGRAGGVLRAVLVVALVAGAALTLSARDGLDWEQLADPLQVRWARVVVGTVAVLLLVALARGLLRRILRARRPAPGGGRAEPEAEPFPALLRVLAVVLVLATIAVVWWVIDAVAPDVLDPRLAPPSTEDQGSDPPLPALGPDWPTLLVVGVVLVVVAVVARLRAVRGDKPTHDEDVVDSEDNVVSDVAELSSAVAAGQAELSGQGDARAAILAAYAAMTARIESGLATGGRSASAADTPTELLARAAAAGLVDGKAAGTLTALFREARFSRHPMGEAARRDAERALAAVRDELVARRA